jgi:pyruvate kinase
MAQIIEAVEEGPISVPALNHVPRTKRGVLSYAARDLGERLSARAIVTFTQSGDTARRLARLHTRLPLLAFTPRPEVRSQLAMSWGVETFLVDYVTSTDAMVRQVDNAILSIGRFKPGDVVVIVAGSPPGASGSTNLIRVHRLGEEDHA